jgi:hypothetical protein
MSHAYILRGKPQKNRLDSGEPITLGGRAVQGIWVHANGSLRLKFRSPGKAFTGVCLYPENASGASVKCAVKDFDGNELFASPVLNDSNRLSPFRVHVGGLAGVQLFWQSTIDSIGWAHGAWADIELE